MKVFLTGGRGMVGRNILAHPLAAELDIHAPARAELDLRRKSDVVDYVAALKPDMIIHAAGKVGGIQANANDPYGFLIENLEIGSNVISAAVQIGVLKVINLSSSCIYPRAVDGLLSEDMILKGELEPTNEGYALAKVAALRLCQFASTDGAGRQYKTVIPCNLYGPWDNFDLHSAHLIPAIIHKVHRAKVDGLPSVEIWSDGQARREFMYAGDLADAVLRMALRFDSAPLLMNLGLGADHTVLEYYRTVADVIGWQGKFTFDHSKPAGMRRKVVDISRQTAWGWQASTPLADGMRSAYQFFLERSRP